MIDSKNLRPDIKKRVEALVMHKQYSLYEAIEEIVIETIAMGGLTACMRPKATLTVITGRPKGDHLIRVTTEPI